MVDLAKFGNNLANSLRNKCVGFEIAIYNDLDLEWSTGEGLAVVTPPTPITSKKRMAVMSMSKTITAAGVVKQIATMQNRGDDISLDEKIDPYLPKPWERGPGVDKLTFRQLLLHTSGLQQASSDEDSYEGLRETIKMGVHGPVGYRNANYCLFRVILPYLILGPATMNQFHDIFGSMFPLALGVEYVKYIVDHVLKPAHVVGVSVDQTGPLPYTRSYATKDLTQSAGDASGADSILHAGAGHWNMSAREYARVIAHLSHGSIMTDAHWKSMLPRPVDGGTGLGLYAFIGKHGTYYGHNGGWGATGKEPGPGAYGGWMVFPDGTSAVMLVNSSNVEEKDPETGFLMPAYDAAA